MMNEEEPSWERVIEYIKLADYNTTHELGGIPNRVYDIMLEKLKDRYEPPAPKINEQSR